MRDVARRLSVVAAFLSGAVPAALAQAPPRDAPQPTGTAVIRGRVIAAAGQRPLAKVEMRAVSGALRVNKIALTDANGRYEIPELPAGRYTVSAARVNYVRASYGERRPLGPGMPIEIAAGQVVTRIDFVLQRTGAIAGRIVDEFGDPAAGVQVSPMRYQYVNGERRLQPAGPGASTNDIGEYRLFGLTPGQYLVSATFRPMNFGGDPNDRTAYLPTFYPGTGNPAEAQRLAVAPGQTVSGVNLALLQVSALRISGFAFDSSGKPLSNGSVNAMPRHLLGIPAGFSAVKADDGSFSIANLPPGDYTLRASAGFSDGEFATANVTVSGGDLTDVQLTAVKPSTVRGRVAFDGQNAKLPLASTLRINGVRPASAPAGSLFANATPKDDWTFEMKTSPGRMIVRGGVAAPGDWRLDRVLTADGADITDAGVDVPGNGTVEGITVVMTTRHNEITGTVVDESGAQVRDCAVVLFAQDSQRWTIGMRHLGVSRPDNDAIFHLRVPAGDYLAVAFEQNEIPGPSYNDPDILQQLREHAVPFSIGPTETKKLELRLSPPPVY